MSINIAAAPPCDGLVYSVWANRSKLLPVFSRLASSATLHSGPVRDRYETRSGMTAVKGVGPVAKNGERTFGLDLVSRFAVVQPVWQPQALL